MQSQSLRLLQEFLSKQQIRKGLLIQSKQLKAKLEFEQITIRSQFDHEYKKSDKKKILKKEIDEQFILTFKQLTRQEKVQYYNKTIDFIVAILNKTIINFDYEAFQGQAFTRSYHLKIWKLKNLRFDNKRNLIFGEREGDIKIYDLTNYINRKSKSHNKDYHIFILESINNKPYQAMRTVHFGFKVIKNYEIFAKNVTTSLNYCLYESLKGELLKKQATITNEVSSFLNTKYTPSINQADKLMQQNIIDHGQSSSNIEETVRSFVSTDSPRFQGDDEQLVEKSMVIANDQHSKDYFEVDDDQPDQEDQEDRNQLAELQKATLYQNQIHRLKSIIPGYDFKDLQSQQNYSQLQIKLETSQAKLLKSNINPNSLKLKMKIPNTTTVQRLVALLTQPQLIKTYNNEIQEIEIKTMIKSENTALIYQKNMPYNKLYRARDFLFLRHVYIEKDVIYIIDKSIEDPHYPPFITIVRGTLQVVCGIYLQKSDISLVTHLEVRHEGYLNQIQNQGLTIKYLKGFLKIFNHVNTNVERQSYQIFDLSSASYQRQPLKSEGLPLQESPQSPKFNYRKSMMIAAKVNIQKMNEQSNHNEWEAVHEIKPEQIEQMEEYNKKIEEIEKKINENGEVIIDDAFRKAHFLLQPLQPKPWDFLELINNKQHPIWKGQWKIDPNGGIIFINQKKISDQNGVLKFIISQIGKNLISGKSILNISLPVDIFAALSNLELLSLSLTYAPYMLQRKVGKSPIEQLKAVVAFGISMSSTYLIMEKPFNPVLGETFQAFIQECPLYAQQISHHPPISALYFIGRGYKLSGQLQSKASLSMNSGYGSNEGVYSFQFEKGSKVRFLGPYGEVSGLIYGERKFNIIGKAYGWVEENNLFVQINFNPKKGFFRKGNSMDSFEGFIYETTTNFMQNFIHSKKKSPPSKNQILKQHGKIHGVWHKQIKYQEEILLDIDVEYPLKMHYEKYPLPSDSNWREDITYRKLLQTTKAQKYKEAIEIKQRADRKLRQNKNKK